MEIGAYSFGDTQRNADGSLRSTTEAIQNLFAAIVHADKAGLDYFGMGEHHTTTMPASSPGAMIAAAAAATTQIKLGSAASIIGTDDPVRIFQQFATADAISGGGRVEITAGRGSSVETFPLFGHSLEEYDDLYAQKLDLLMTINDARDRERHLVRHRCGRASTTWPWCRARPPASCRSGWPPAATPAPRPAPGSWPAGVLRHHRRGAAPLRPAGRPLPPCRCRGRPRPRSR